MSLGVIASLPGCVGGEKAAWYQLLAHVQPFSINLQDSHSQSMWIISGHNIEGLIYTHAHTLKVTAKLFCRICYSEVQLKYYTALFSDVRVQEDWPSHTAQVLLVTVENNSLSTHNCRSCVGKVEWFKWKLKDLRSRLA